MPVQPRSRPVVVSTAANVHALGAARASTEADGRTWVRVTARKAAPASVALPEPGRAGAADVAGNEARPSSFFAGHLAAHLALFQRLAVLEPEVTEAADRLAACLSAGGKLLICGNGDSSAEAQRMVATLAGEGSQRHRPLAALALGADGVALSGSANAYGFDEALARQVRALGRAGDALLLLHAGGPSGNLLRAADVARDAGLLTMGLLGSESGDLRAACHLSIVMPADASARVGEAQGFIGHMLCGLIEAGLGLD